MRDNFRKCDECDSEYNVLELRNEIGSCPWWIGKFCSNLCRSTVPFNDKGKSLIATGRVLARKIEPRSFLILRIKVKTLRERVFTSMHKAASDSNVKRKGIAAVLDTDESLGGFLWKRLNRV